MRREFANVSRVDRGRPRVRGRRRLRSYVRASRRSPVAARSPAVVHPGRAAAAVRRPLPSVFLRPSPSRFGSAADETFDASLIGNSTNMMEYRPLGSSDLDVSAISFVTAAGGGGAGGGRAGG